MCEWYFADWEGSSDSRKKQRGDGETVRERLAACLRARSSSQLWLTRALVHVCASACVPVCVCVVMGAYVPVRRVRLCSNSPTAPFSSL